MKKIYYLLLVLLFVSCGVSDTTKRNFESATSAISEASNHIDNQKSGLNSIKDGPDWAFLSIYDAEENWSQNFTDASSLLSEAESKYKSTSDLLSSSKNEAAVKNATSTILKLISGAKAKANFPGARSSSLLEARDNAQEYISAGKKSYAELTSTLTSATKVLNTTTSKHPTRKNDLNDLFRDFTDVSTRSKVSYDLINQIESNISASLPVDYSDLLLSKDTLSAHKKLLSSRLVSFTKETASLDQSYSKTLEDMRVDYFIPIERTSWDESDDYTRENIYQYAPVTVTKGTYDALATNDGLLARSESGWGNSTHSFKDQVRGFSTLKLDPNERVSSRYTTGSYDDYDDKAEYFLGNGTYEKYYHKYLIEENGEVVKAEWEEVGEDDFYDYAEALGMTIYSKPYGMFEFEASEEASPPGMEYVGNSKYGKWKDEKDESGRSTSVWIFYSRYSYWYGYSPGYPYYRYDYDDYRRNYRGQHGYYGTDTGGNKRYGTGGSVSSRSKSNIGSTYVRDNPGALKPVKNGAKRTTPISRSTSVRNAASSSRSRGPGGGGK